MLTLSTVWKRRSSIRRVVEVADTSSKNDSKNSSKNSSKNNSGKKNSANDGAAGSKSGSVSSKRAQIANYAVQFVGNRYVYGGTSLTNGTDCSGFTMSVMAKFGVSLPHNSGAQSGCGKSITSSQMRPGDLVFYSGSGGTTTWHFTSVMVRCAMRPTRGPVSRSLPGTIVLRRRS